MRTTLTIDDALVRELREIAHRTETPFKDVVEKSLRVGLSALSGRDDKRPFRALTHAMGTPSVALDKALALSAQLEDDESLRKLSVRK